MLEWAAGVEKIIAKPPGSDEGFSPEQIARYADTNFSKMSTWAIVCEEVLDTQFPHVYFERAREELHRRGITDEELAEMRSFAWLTGGWLNFDRMLWDWCNLDEQDIFRAIEGQYSDGWISEEERERRIQYAKRYDKVA